MVAHLRARMGAQSVMPPGEGHRSPRVRSSRFSACACVLAAVWLTETALQAQVTAEHALVFLD